MVKNRLQPLRSMLIVLVLLLLAFNPQLAPAVKTGETAQIPLAPQVSIRYVAKSGSDLGPNDCLLSSLPCLTIGRALQAAADGDLVRVAEGTYLENLHIQKTLTLEGGYNSLGWNRDIALYETIIDGSSDPWVIGDWDGGYVNAPEVIQVSGGFKMWYIGQNAMVGSGSGVGLAESSDGLLWTRHPSNPLLPGAAPAVIFEDGLYKMWYSDTSVHAATSADGVSWTPYAGNPVLSPGGAGSFDEYGITSASVIHDTDGYKMWYSGENVDSTQMSIGYATSDDGLAWTKFAGNPVLEGTPGEWDQNFALNPSAVKIGSGFKLYYSAFSGIGLATSVNGVDWTKEPTNPVIGYDWRGYASIRAPSVLWDGSSYRMWFQSGPTSNRRFGYATSNDGVDWSMHDGEVFGPGDPNLGGSPAVWVDNAPGPVRLDGLTITGGKTCSEAGGGGGVAVNATDVTVTYSLIQDNLSCIGAGIHVREGGGDNLLKIEHTRIVGNNVNNGPNRAGGGIHIGQGNNAEIRYTEILSNTTSQNGTGGGLSFDSSQSILVEDSLIAHNAANGGGGGVSISQGSAIIRRSWLIGNSTNSGDGAGVNVADAALLLEDSQLTGNTAYAGVGGIASEIWDASAVITATNTIIAGNHGTTGGGLAPFYAGSLTNVTVYGNTCTSCANAGVVAGQDAQNSPHVLRNSILYGNTGLQNLTCAGVCDVSYSDIQGWSGGTGNLDTNPILNDPLNGDFHLASASPCIDAAGATGAPDHDFEADARPLNGGFDMGADEFDGPHADGGVVMRLLPASGTIYVGQPLSVLIQVEAGAQPVDSAEAHLDFDPGRLQVTGYTAGSDLNYVFPTSGYDNNLGRFDFAAAKVPPAPPYPSGTFTLATLTIQPVAKTLSTSLLFEHRLPRQSIVNYQGSVLNYTVNAAYRVRDDAQVAGSVQYQGRPAPPHIRLAAPLEIDLTATGALRPTTLITTTTDHYGNFYLEDIPPGQYSIRVRDLHSLWNAQSAALALGENSLDFGLLLEGDANGDNCIKIADFSILVTTFQKQSGDAGYNDLADFNEDDNVNTTDFSWLAANYNQCGAPPAAPARSASGLQLRPAEANVILVIEPPSTQVLETAPFTITVQLQTGEQLVDGTDIYLDFDPARLKVLQVRGNSLAFPTELWNQYDNTLGRIDYSAGAFSNFPHGTFDVARIEFEALDAVDLTGLHFSNTGQRLTEVVYAGNSVLSGLTDGVVTILPLLKLYLPLTLRQ